MANYNPSEGNPLPLPSRNQNALNVCSAAGIDLLGRERIKLSHIRDGLRNSITEISNASNWDETISRSLLAANLIKASCDAFIEMAGAFGEAFELRGVGTFAKGYSATSALTTAGTQMATGQKVDWVATATAAAKPFTGKAGELESLAELNLVKVDIVNYAVRGENAKALQAVFLEYIPIISGMSLKYMEQKVKAKWVGATTSIVNSGLNYSRALEEAFNHRLDDQDYARSKHEINSSLLNKIAGVDANIKEIDQIMQDCASVPLRLR